ncbi:MAG: hypothetical protein QM655_09725 [Nocardioidaceae bacterium]
MTALPSGSRILHIGPHKTGTTTVQRAFHANRARLFEAGVLYPGPTAHPMRAAMAAAGGRALATDPASNGPQLWADLVAEIRAHPDHTAVVSSEFLCETTPGRIETIVGEIGADRVQVVVTVRPLVRLLGSQWQQYMQNRPALSYDDTMGYEGWLDAVLNHPDRGVTPSFWRRHRHDHLVQRWARVVGPERVTVIVIDESDRGMVLAAFARLLGVGKELLRAEQAAANRSLTYPELRVLCAFNELFMASGWGIADYTRFVRFGLVRNLLDRQPDPGEPRLRTPRWAVEKACAIGEEIADGIGSMGLGHVIGDLESLSDPAMATEVGDNDGSQPVPPEIAAGFVAAMIRQVDQIRPYVPPGARDSGPVEHAIRTDKRGRRARSELADLEDAIARAERDLRLAAPPDELTAGQIARLLGRRAKARVRR